MDLLLTSPEPKRKAPRAAAACGHCGAPLVDKKARASGFCCLGCAYVHRLILEQGHEAYYRIKDPLIAPADAGVFEARDYSWLTALQREREEAAGGDSAEFELAVQGISCAGCVWLIERVSRQERGLLEIQVNASAGSLHARWRRGAFDAGAWAARIGAFGYVAGPLGDGEEPLESARLARRLGLAAACAMNVMLFTLPAYFGMRPDFEYAGLFRLLALLFATLGVLAGGGYFFSRAFLACRARRPHIDQPIALGILGAYGGSLYGWLSGDGRFLYFDFVATFTCLMLAGRWAQVRAVERNRRRLLRIQPVPRRIRLREGGEVRREELRAGQPIVLAPGQAVPVDARLEEEPAEFSLASICGEAEPRLIPAGGRVPAGAVNLGRSSVRLVTLQAWADSLVAQLLRTAAPRREAPGAWERLVSGYVVGILLLSFGSAAAWRLSGHSAGKAGMVGISVLVVSCPCALGLALPLAEEVATAAARSSGVFVRDRTLRRRLGRVRQLVFDKTGTLTLETPVLAHAEDLSRLAGDARAALAALTQGSLHPVGQCLWENLVAQGAVAPAPGPVEEVPGSGVRLGGWTLGRAGWADSGGTGPDTVLAQRGEAVARFKFLDSPRSDARRQLGALGRAGYAITILSGDHPDRVAAFADALGLPPSRALGAQSAEDKAEWISAQRPESILMLGDGANDGPAFDRALCRGTPIIHRGVLESKADFYYLRQGVQGIGDLLRIARGLRRSERALVVFSVGYNLLASGCAVAGLVNPLVAAILMPASSLASLFIVGAGLRPMLAGGPMAFGREG